MSAGVQFQEPASVMGDAQEKPSALTLPRTQQGDAADCGQNLWHKFDRFAG